MSEDLPQREGTYLVLEPLPGDTGWLAVEVRQIRQVAGELLVLEVAVPRAEVRPAALAILAEAIAARASRLRP